VGHPFQFAVCNSWWCFNLFRIYCSVGFCIQCDAALSQDLCVCIWLVVPTSMSCIQEASTSDLDAPCYCFMVFNYAAPAARKWVPTRLFVRQNNTTPCLNLCWAFFNTTHNFACSLLPARWQTELHESASFIHCILDTLAIQRLSAVLAKECRRRSTRMLL